MHELADKVALVTGAAGDIGCEIARQLLERGARVVLTDVAHEQLLERAEGLARLGPVTTVAADLADVVAVRALAVEALERFGRIDFLVNNAAIQAAADLDECTVELMDLAYAVNVRAPFVLAQALVPAMRSIGGGAIVNIASVHATSPGPKRLAYATTKTALLGMTRSLAVDLGTDNIRVNAVSPGATLTGQLRAAWEKHPAGVDLMTHAVGQHPLGRIAEVADIAEAVLYLLQTRFISGTEVRVDGGFLAALRLLPPIN